jgi:hypothetical protein
MIYLCNYVCISHIGNNNFCEIKINHKVSDILMHSCYCTLFYVMSGFDLNAKSFKNHLKIYLKSGLEKEKKGTP